MKSTKKLISIALVAALASTSMVTAISASAATKSSDSVGSTALSSKYSTNGTGVGTSKTISSASDWTSAELIAQGVANDDANVFKGPHEYPVYDDYALYAAWDNTNLYIGWQYVDVRDVTASDQQGAGTNEAKPYNADIPQMLAFDLGTGHYSDGGMDTAAKNRVWGINISYDTNVDAIMCFSSKPGVGTPALFTTNDKGEFSYGADYCRNFKSLGISFKYEDGLFGGNKTLTGIKGNGYTGYKPADITSDSSAWTDLASGHKSSLDTFYTMTVPLSALGITKDYIENNGIGIMHMSTYGESGIGSVPMDYSMLDAATDEYSKDPSSTAEKEDSDTITVPLARVGKGDINPPTPKPTTATNPTVPTTTQKVTTPTTEKPASNLTVKATSNFFPEKSLVLADDAMSVTVTYDLKSNKKLVNGQWALSYDSSKLSFNSAKNSELMPYINGGTVRVTDGEIKGNFTNIDELYDFTTSKEFVTVTFDVIGTGNTTVDLKVQELSVGQLSGGSLTYTTAVKNSVDTGKESFTKATNIVADETPTVVSGLKVNAKSNVFTSATTEFNKNTNQINVTYKLTSSMNIYDTQWVLKYDANKLSLASTANAMPKMKATVRNTTAGTVKGYATSESLVSFNNEAFVSLTFDVIGSGNANINLDVQDLSVGYFKTGSSTPTYAYIISDSSVVDLSSKTGFTKAKVSGTTALKGTGDSTLYGDVNGDGTINVTDATTIQHYLVGLAILSDEHLTRADADRDGRVSIKDATLIQKYLVGIVPSI
ncbi:MAG: dockerin type I domain-containing protein [Ruminococcus sp.]|nr:dockerin type I domain-containing protein [Ruminococcus sp.]